MILDRSRLSWTPLQGLPSAIRALACGAALLAATSLARAQSTVGTVAVGNRPAAVAVNPATNKIYVANLDDGNVTVIDGWTSATTTVAVGAHPNAVAVNPATGKVYVTNSGDGTVTVIDGVSNATTTVNVGIDPRAVAVNPVTNRVYVANYGPDPPYRSPEPRPDYTVTVIDGATNATETVIVENRPTALAVNPVTNKVYVANFGDSSPTGGRIPGHTVSVIDGFTNATATVAVGLNPGAVSVNPVTNKIYVANSFDGTVTVIDGATNATATVAIGPFPPHFISAVAVNPLTNKAYVTSAGSDSVIVIDGAANTTSTVPVGGPSSQIAVNPVTNKVYFTHWDVGSLTELDGSTNATTTVTVGGGPGSVAVNPVTNRVYVADWGSYSSSVPGHTVAVVDWAANLMGSVATGNGPGATAVNPVTNRVYIANSADGTVTVIDEVTNTTATVAVGKGPAAVAVNPVANRIYVANLDDGTVTAIDGSTHATATVFVGSHPSHLAVNPVTDKIYVANGGEANSGNTVTVIDGATNATATVTVGSGPADLGINPVTNRIYVANQNEGTATVIDGVTNATTSIPLEGEDSLGYPARPTHLAVNPVSNRIYVANSSGRTLTEIDGATNATRTISSATYFGAVAVNPVTDRIYAVDVHGCGVIVLDGGTRAMVDAVPLGADPSTPHGDLAVNPVTNRVYVASHAMSGEPADTLTVIDGSTNASTILTMEAWSGHMAVNPATDKVYCTHPERGRATVIGVDGSRDVPIVITATGVVDGQTVANDNLFATVDVNPSFTATVTSAYSATPSYSGLGGLADPPPTALYHWVDDGAVTPWKKASPTSPPNANPAIFTIGLSSGSLGLHTLYLYAAYGDEGAGVSGHSSGISRLQAVSFIILTIPTTTTVTVDANPQNAGSSVLFTARVSPDKTGAAVPSGTVSFLDGSTLLGSTPLVGDTGSYTATYQTRSLAAGVHSIRVAYSGDSTFGASSGTLTQRIADNPVSVSAVSGNGQTAKVKHPFTNPLIVQVLDRYATPVPNVTVTFTGKGLDFSSGGIVTTGTTGLARVTVTPTRGGTLTATATVEGVGTPARFTETGGGKK